MRNVHIEVPLADGRPPARSNEQGCFVREINLKAARRRRGCDSTTLAKIDPVRAERFQCAIHAELETAGIRLTGEIGLIRYTIFTHARRDCRIETHAGSKPVMRIRPGTECGCDGRLARLNFHAARITQRYKFTRTLEVIVDSADRS